MYPNVVASLEKTVMVQDEGVGVYVGSMLCSRQVALDLGAPIERDSDVTSTNASRSQRSHVMWPAKYRFQAYRLYKEVRRYAVGVA